MRIEFTLDCYDLERTSEFWQAAVGFEVEGTKRKAAFREGAFADTYIMARLR